jgi:hypothetical protein
VDEEAAQETRSGGAKCGELTRVKVMAKQQRTPEEIADEEKRTTPMGRYNTACSYYLAAEALEKAEPEDNAPDHAGVPP